MKAKRRKAAFASDKVMKVSKVSLTIMERLSCFGIGSNNSHSESSKKVCRVRKLLENGEPGQPGKLRPFLRQEQS